MRRASLGLVALAALALTTSVARADSLEDTFRAGNEAYFRGDYAGAIAQYEDLLDLGVRDPDVYYNLGNAYARSGFQGRAIASYERSLRLGPGDRDAIAALDRSRGIIASRRAEREGEATVESGPPIGEAVFGRVSADSLAISLLLLEAFLFALLAAFPFVRREHLRLAMGIAAPLLGIAVMIAGLGLAIRTGAFDDGDPAVVVRDRVALREGPREDAQERARLREGERAWIVARDGAWVRVHDDARVRVGWIAAEDVVALEER